MIRSFSLGLDLDKDNTTQEVRGQTVDDRGQCISDSFGLYQYEAADEDTTICVRDNDRRMVYCIVHSCMKLEARRGFQWSGRWVIQIDSRYGNSTRVTGGTCGIVAAT